MTDENDIIVCFSHEYIHENNNYIDKLKVIKIKENDYEIVKANTIEVNPCTCPDVENMVKISNNRFIMYYDTTNNITLWKIDNNYSLKYLSKTQLLREYPNEHKLGDIFVLNKDIIIPKFETSQYLYFWKINEDNTLANI